MTDKEIKTKIFKIIKKMTDENVINNIDENKNLITQLGFDSMDILDLAIKIKSEFDIKVDQEDLKYFTDLNKTIKYIKNKIIT